MRAPSRAGWRGTKRAALAVAAAVLVGILLHVALNDLLGAPYPFLPFLAGALVALRLAGVWAAATALVTGFLAGVALLAREEGLAAALTAPGTPTRVLLYWASGGIGLGLLWALGAARTRAAYFADRARDTAGEAARWQAITDVVLDSAPVGIGLFDADFHMLRVNRALEAMSGLPAAALIGRRFTELFPDVGAAARIAFETVVRTGVPVVGFEVQGRTPGSPVLHTWRGSLYPVRVPGDAAVAVAVMVEEVTAQRAAVTRLEESEARFREIANLIPQVVWTADAAGRLEYYNQQWLDYVGMTAEEARVRGWAHVVHPDDVERLRAEWRRAVRRATPAEIEFRQRSRHGEYRWFLCRAVPVRARDGAVVRWLGTSTDVEDKRRVEEALRVERDLVETVNRVGHALLTELDPDRLLRAIADATAPLVAAQWCAFVPAPPAEAGGGFLLPAAAGEDAARAQLTALAASPVLVPALREGRCVRLGDDRAGAIGTVAGVAARSVLAVPVASRAGDPLGVLVFGHAGRDAFAARDERLLTGLAAEAAVAIENARLYEAERRARAAAEAANRAKDEFLSVLSHELRSPLNAASLWLDLIRGGRVAGEQAAAGIDTVHRSVRLLQRLIEDLLDVSRIVGGKLEVQHRPLDAVAVLRRAVDEQHLAFAAKGVRLVADDAAPAPVLGDAGRLQQVFGNLLTNAWKFTPAGGEARVTVERDAAAVSVALQDTGQGIPPDVLPRLFDRFWQADRSSTRRHAGLGLGLAIARHLVERHGGTLTAESAGEGCGATFRVRLPLAAPREGRRTGEGREVRRTGACRPLDGVSVVVVDDDRDALAALEAILDDAGAAVRTATSAAEALDLLHTRPPDVLLSDIAMPGTDGYELIERLRTEGPPQARAVPAIAVTAYATRGDRRRAIRAGYDGHVAKPVEAAALLRMIARLAGHRAA